MYNTEDFKQCCSVEPGELVLKFPGTDVKLLYNESKGFVNGSGTMGYLALNVVDLVTQETADEALGQAAQIGLAMRAQSANPALKPYVQKLLASNPVTLGYSITKARKEVLTTPMLTGGLYVDDRSIDGLVVCSYGLAGRVPSVEEVYQFHQNAVVGKDLVADLGLLEQQTPDLVRKANRLYQQALELMKQ